MPYLGRAAEVMGPTKGGRGQRGTLAARVADAIKADRVAMLRGQAARPALKLRARPAPDRKYRVEASGNVRPWLRDGLPKQKWQHAASARTTPQTPTATMPSELTAYPWVNGQRQRTSPQQAQSNQVRS